MSTYNTRIGEVATREANRAVTEEIRRSEAAQTKPPWKRKAYSVFSSEQRAAMGNFEYAAENGNAAAIKKFKGDIDGQLGESTVRLFKQKYYRELSKAKESTPRGEAVEVKSIPSKKKRTPSHSWGH